LKFLFFLRPKTVLTIIHNIVSFSESTFEESQSKTAKTIEQRSKPMDLYILCIKVVDSLQPGALERLAKWPKSPHGSDEYIRRLQREQKRYDERFFSRASAKASTSIITGVNVKGESVCLKVEGFQPSVFYIAETEAGVRWSTRQCHTFIGKMQNFLKTEVSWKREYKHRLYGFRVAEKCVGSRADMAEHHLCQFICVRFPTVSLMKRAIKKSGCEGVNSKLPIDSMTLGDVPAHEAKYISPENKFCDDVGIRFNSWLRVEQEHLISVLPHAYHSHCTFEYVCNKVNVKASTWSDEVPCPVANLRVCSMDIETYTPRKKRTQSQEGSVGTPRCFPEASYMEDTIIMIASTIWRSCEDPNGAVVIVQCLAGPASNSTRGVTKEKALASLNDNESAVESTVFEVEVYETERELLNAWARLVVTRQIEIVTGYNIWKFDYAYITERAKRVGAYGIWCLSTLACMKASAREQNLTSNALGETQMTHIDMFGRVSLDVFLYIKTSQKLQSYTLKNVARVCLPNNHQKVDLPYTEMMELYEMGPTERRRVADYCAMDAVIPIQLMAQLSILTIMMEMGNVCSTSLEDIATKGQQNKITHLLVFYAHQFNVVMTNKPQPKTTGDQNNDKYEGATVLEPKRDYYTEPVVTLDFASLYPSIMQAHNLCYSTLVMGGPSQVEWLRSNTNVELQTFGEHTFVKNVVGVLPKILESLLVARRKAKKAMAMERDPLRRKVYDGQQLALKISANSVYGFTGCPAPMGRYGLRAIAETVTKIGRTLLETSKLEVEKRWPVEVIYGDTDSIMILCKAFKHHDTSGKPIENDNLQECDVKAVREAYMERCIQFGREAAKYVTEIFQVATDSKAISLEFEKLFLPYLLFDKKRYAGIKYESSTDDGVIDCKGISSVRRDNCLFAKSVMSSVLYALLRLMDVPEALRVMVDMSSKLLEPIGSVVGVSVNDLILSKSMRSEYKNNKQPHVNVAVKIKSRDPGTEPVAGDRVPFLITVQKNKDALYYELAEDPGFVVANKIPINVEYYWKKQICKPLTAILKIATPRGFTDTVTNNLTSRFEAQTAQVRSLMQGNQMIENMFAKHHQQRQVEDTGVKHSSQTTKTNNRRCVGTVGACKSSLEMSNNEQNPPTSLQCGDSMGEKMSSFEDKLTRHESRKNQTKGTILEKYTNEIKNTKRKFNQSFLTKAVTSPESSIKNAKKKGSKMKKINSDGKKQSVMQSYFNAKFEDI
jgi:DNA polymerase elongation subunit (family B)